MFHFTRRHQPLVCLLTLVLVFFATPRLARAQITGYFVTDVGPANGSHSRAFSINSSGNVAGGSLINPDDFNTQPFFWSVGEFTNIGNFGGDGGEAYALNDLNYAVGSADLPTGTVHPFIWSSVFGKRDLGTLGGDFAVAWDINNASQVVGQSEIKPLIDRAFIWSAATGIQSLGTLPGGSNSTARGINESGQVVGESSTSDGQTHAFLYSGGAMSDLGTLGGNLSIAFELNDEAKVVGYSRLNNNGINPPYHAFLRTASGMIDLGTLGGNSIAFDINNRGAIVGYAEVTPGGVRHAFIYDPQNGMRDLNVLTPGSGWILEEARSINESGLIVGVGVNPAGQTRGFLLQSSTDEIPPPAPPPCTTNAPATQFIPPVPVQKDSNGELHSFSRQINVETAKPAKAKIVRSKGIQDQ